MVVYSADNGGATVKTVVLTCSAARRAQPQLRARHVGADQTGEAPSGVAGRTCVACPSAADMAACAVFYFLE